MCNGDIFGFFFLYWEDRLGIKGKKAYHSPSVPDQLKKEGNSRKLSQVADDILVSIDQTKQLSSATLA